MQPPWLIRRVNWTKTKSKDRTGERTVMICKQYHQAIIALSASTGLPNLPCVPAWTHNSTSRDAWQLRSDCYTVSNTVHTAVWPLHCQQHSAHCGLTATLSATLCTQSPMNPARGVFPKHCVEGHVCGALPPFPYSPSWCWGLHRAISRPRFRVSRHGSFFKSHIPC